MVLNKLKGGTAIEKYAKINIFTVVQKSTCGRGSKNEYSLYSCDGEENDG